MELPRFQEEMRTPPLLAIRHFQGRGVVVYHYYQKGY